MSVAPTAAKVWCLGEDLDESCGCAVMRIYLGKGFWFMRGMPGKQGPMWNKTLYLMLNLLYNAIVANSMTLPHILWRVCKLCSKVYIL